MSRARNAVRLAFMFSLAAATGHAQPAAPDPSSAAHEQEARDLYQQGVTDYDLADYDHAIEKFKAAYALSRAPRLLYDIAQSYRLEGARSCGNAAQFYRTYLRVKPDAENRPAVEGWLRELAACEQHPPAATTESPPPPAPRSQVSPDPSRAPTSPSRPWLRWTLLGGGLATAAAGGAVLAWVNHDLHAAEAGCRPRCTELRDDLSLRADLAYVLLGLGAAMLATGTVVWFHERQAYVAPTSAGIVVGGVF